MVVIGASAGGIQALIEVVRALPSDFPGAIFVVLHVPARESFLPKILSNSGSIPAMHARNGEPILPGRIYVAPPDYHLLVRKNRLELSHGPRENRFRPAVDPLFRSAARAFGTRVAGVVLSGALSDGTSGLFAIKAHGGTAIVQDPNEALSRSMPQTALQLAEVDYVLPARSIGELLTTLASRPSRSEGRVVMTDDFERTRDAIQEDFDEQVSNRRMREISTFTCPECGGPLWQTATDPIVGFQCHVGHAYNGEALLDLKSEEVEAALWASVRLLKERLTLSRQFADRLRASGQLDRAERIEEQAIVDDEHVRSLRELIEVEVDPLAALVLDSQGPMEEEPQ